MISERVQQELDVLRLDGPVGDERIALHGQRVEVDHAGEYLVLDRCLIDPQSVRSGWITGTANELPES